LFIDPTGLEIEKTFSLDLMTNYRRQQTKLGNSSTMLFSAKGCYVTGIANALGSLRAHTFRGRVDRGPDFKATMELNQRSELFDKDSGNMPLESMEKVFGEGNWDYWTKRVQGKETLQELLKGYAESDKKYLVLGVFDLSSANPEVPNHMVGINALPEDDGVFAKDSIVATSQGDVARLGSDEQRQAYSMENFKEFRVIEVKP
jgi:hypothetical protein